MPLFHSNAVYAGWSVAPSERAPQWRPRAFRHRRSCADVRRYGATYMNYVGKPLAYILATPEQSDDADNLLRVAFGNEAADRDIEAFGRRFGCTVWDGFGSTETAVIITRPENCPPGSISQGFPGVAISNAETGPECEVARFDAHRRPAERRGRDGGVGQHRRQRTVPRATTTTPAPPVSGCAAASTGPATWPIATRTAGSTWPAARRTGCGSTART